VTDSSQTCLAFFTIAIILGLFTLVGLLTGLVQYTLIVLLVTLVFWIASKNHLRPR
jgi:hypothetical protein